MMVASPPVIGNFPCPRCAVRPKMQNDEYCGPCFIVRETGANPAYVELALGELIYRLPRPFSGRNSVWQRRSNRRKRLMAKLAGRGART